MSPYLLSHLARHGSSIQRLKEELQIPSQFGDTSNPIQSISFDAANLVWAFLASYGFEEISKERWFRNAVADSIASVIETAIESGKLPKQPWHLENYSY
jgi:hypothetical protein